MYNTSVILTDARRRILWVNDQFEVMTGYSKRELVGKSPGSILQGPESSKDAVLRIRKALAEEKPFEDALINYRKNGEAYVCQLAIHPIHDHQQNLTNFLAFETEGEMEGFEASSQAKSHAVLPRRYESSSLRGLNEIRLFERVQRVMKQEKLYLNPKLTLRMLASKLETNIKYLSQVINLHGNTNFLGYVNSYRLEEFRYRILAGDSRHTTLFGIAQRCGFKNKSTFFKVFRDQMGMTPKAFQDKLLRQRRSE
ncbi:helix-turn-helix domain-containing protein [Neolewinella agarilytica]|uniref:helix-turn-helix domain-containing protein n=1 Tax=Neolewinella agarilytica TaxID=478744 RepID=UPI0023567D42|nr:PAS domain-containing protein [Neolewinella agarilytica]